MFIVFISIFQANDLCYESLLSYIIVYQIKKQKFFYQKYQNYYEDQFQHQLSFQKMFVFCLKQSSLSKNKHHNQLLNMKHHQTIKQSLLSQKDQSPAQSAKASYLSNLPVIDGSNLFQRFFFTWLHPFLNFSSKQGVTVQSMPSLPDKFKTIAQHQRLIKIWQSIPEGSAQGWRLIKTIYYGYRGQIIGLLIFLIFCVCFYLTQPIMTSYNIDYIQNHQGDLSYGLELFFLSLIFQIINKLCFAQYMYRFNFIGVKWCNALNTMIYFKSLKYSTLANKKFSEAEIINYSQTDAERMTYAGYQLSSIIYGPIQIIFGLTMMYFYVGISFLVGVSTIVLLIIANYFISKKANQYYQKTLKAKDMRMKVAEQMLDTIRFIKISAIEKFFFNKLKQKRLVQMTLYLKKGLLFVITIFLFWISCPLLLSLTFVTYVALGNELTSQVAFTVMMLGSIIQYPIYSLPTAISELIQVMVSIRRIQKFLLAEDIKSDLIQVQKDSDYAIRIQNGNFFWQKQEKTQQEKDKQLKQKQQEEGSQQKLEQQEQKQKKFELIHVLKDLNLSIKKGKFVMIVGDIGSGKSSLLLAILNQMINHQGSKVYLSGSIAYSAQKPWIMSKSVKENITFNLPFDQEKFKKVIYHSSFEHDLSILPHKQETEIGEKGINISGGQKARLSLARALYSQNDIYLLDDILSAVDVHVGDFLVKQTLKGLLRGKTIIMPTHAIRYIEQADQIIVMSKGQIVQKGSYNQICKSVEFQEICMHEAEHEKQSKQKNQQENIDAQIAMIAEVFKQKTHSREVEKQITNINDVIIQQLILPQDQQKGQVNFKIFKQFIQNAGGFYKFVLPVLLSMLFWIVCRTLSSIFIEKNCQNPTQNNQQLYLFIVFIMLSNVFILIRAIVMVVSSTNQGNKVHDKLMKSLLYASLSNFFNRVPVGRIVNRLTKDLRQIDQDIVDAIAWLIISFFELLSTLIICIYASSVFAIIPMIIVGVLSHKVRKYYMKTQRELSRYQKSTNSPVVSSFMSTISGLSSIRAYKLEDKFFEMQMVYTDINKRVRLNKSGVQNWFCNILTFLSFLVNMPCIAYCMFSNSSNPSLVGLLMVYALGLCEGMTNMTLSFAYFETKLISMERIYTFMSIQPEQGYKNYCSQWSPQQQGGKQVFNQGTIEFRDVCARYREGLPDILKEISCSIQAGQKIGIVGRTGAGKSTIINTLLRMTEVSAGKLIIDGNEIEKYQLKDLRFSITMIDQQPTLIKSNFRQNLDITSKYTDKQLESILKECNLYEIIQQKGGIDGNVSNVSLSAGEKQLLCICRAFLKNSRIVLIDEATANIDVRNDAIIQKVITEKFKNSTVLTIAHRLSTLQNSDKIMVLQKGRLIEFGRPSELEKKVGGFYADMLKKNTAQMLS